MLIDREARERHRGLTLRLHRDSILEQARTVSAKQLELRVHGREAADSARIAILYDVGEEALGVAALDVFNETEIFALDSFCN